MDKIITYNMRSHVVITKLSKSSGCSLRIINFTLDDAVVREILYLPVDSTKPVFIALTLAQIREFQ